MVTKLLKQQDNSNSPAPTKSLDDLTASQYNGGQLSKTLDSGEKVEVKNLFFVDWFEVTMKPATLPIPWETKEDEFTIDDGYIVFQLSKPNGTKHYKRAYNIWIDGFDFGQMLVNPRNSKIMKGNPVQFKIKNNVLYEKEWIDRFTQFRLAMGYEVSSYTRVDIAIDGYGFLDIFKQMDSGDIKRVGRKCFFKTHKEDGKELEFTGIDLGSKSSSKMITAYKKGARIEVDNKVYIKEAWKKNGLTNLESVERIELKMRSECIKKMPQFKYQFLDDPLFLAAICQTQFQRFCEFVDANELEAVGGNVSKVERVEFINWGNAKGILLDKKTTKPSGKVYAVKLACKQDYDMYYLTGNKAYLEMAEERAAWHDLEEWLDKRKEAWHHLFDWRERQRAKGKLRN